jgi:tripartite-type tricarboxylate transporter receptor subunit TctC
MKPNLVGLTALCAGLLFSAGIANAQEKFPTRPIEFIVPYGPGGGTDLVSRIVAAGMSKELGQPVVVLNRPGAGASVAGEMVANAPPDGHRVMLLGSGFKLNPFFFKDLPFDVRTDLEPITAMVGGPEVMLVNAKLPVKTVKELIEYAKNNKNVNFATLGHGTSSHVNIMAMEYYTGTDLYDVAYSGGGPAMAAVISGESQVLFATLLAALPSIQAGTVRALAVTSDHRVTKWLPDVPTFIESGIDFENTGFFGIATTKGTPPAIVKRLYEAAAAALKNPEARKLIEDQGQEVIANTPEEFTKYIDDGRKKLSAILNKFDITEKPMPTKR